MGVSGCGKSTVGRLLAADFGCPFIEGDDYHDDSSIAKMRAGVPLTDDDRWPWLDRIGNATQLAFVVRVDTRLGGEMKPNQSSRQLLRDRPNRNDSVAMNTSRRK